MKRVLFLGFVLLAAGGAVACGGKTFPSLCTGDVSAPAACNQACDPAPGAPRSCPIGFHCSADGKCDSVCTLTGDQCGNDYFCTLDGHCQANDDPGPSGGDGDACPGVHVAAAKTTPTVQLLLDQSGSMTSTYGGGMNPPRRWDAMVTALVGDPDTNTTGVVQRLADRVVFGATLFTGEAPGMDHTPTPGRCPVLTPFPFQPRVLNNSNAISQLLRPPTKPNDETPTPESIDAVVKDFKDHPPMTGSPPIIVLATDGLPDTCQDANPSDADQPKANAATEAAAKRAFDAGIKLFYLFIGPDGAAAHAQRMANAGAGLNLDTGTAKYYVANNPAELSAAFDQIVGGVLSCDLRLSGIIDPSDAQSGVVTVNGNMLTYGTDWNIDPDGITMHLLGAACDMVKNNPNSTVDAVFACGTVIF